MLYVACGIFICVGLGFIFSGDHELVPGGMMMAGFAFFLLILGHFFTTGSGIAYFISEKAIVLKQGKKIRSIKYDELESITPLKENQSEEFLVKLQNTLVDRQRGIMSNVPHKEQSTPLPGLFGSLKKVFTEQIRAYDKFKFLSVPIAYSGGESGVQRGPEKSSGADLPCETVFILLKSGESYMISPLDTKGFVAEAKKYFNP